MKKLIPLAALLAATSVSAGDFDTVDVKLAATSGDWTIEHVVDGTDVKVKRAFSLLGSETSSGIPMSVAWSAEDGPPRPKQLNHSEQGASHHMPTTWRIPASTEYPFERHQDI